MTTTDGDRITIVIADDDPDDRLLIHEAFAEARLNNQVDFVEDGVELLEYLCRTGSYEHLSGNFLPGLVLLDLNMPRMGGREAIEKIRADPKLHRIPIVVLTTSKSEEDIIRTYDLGINSFITKPVTFDTLVDVIKTMTQYWLQIVRFPAK